VEKDEYRKRFDTSDAIILPMVQKGKVEETILESIPQLAIQLLNTGLLGQLQRIPALTVFSISLSALSLTNTLWYYSYWNLFRCKPIRDVPSALALYNYKMSGVKDGPLSFSKASREVVDVELSAMEMTSVTVGGTVLNAGSAGDEQLQLPPKNEKGHASAAELTRVRDAVVSHVPVGRSPSVVMPDTDAEMRGLRRENQEKEAEIAQPREAEIAQPREEKETENAKLREENSRLRLELQRLQEAENAKLREENSRLRLELQRLQEAENAKLREENNKLRLVLQRLPSVALGSAGTGARAAAHVTQAAAAGGGNINGINTSASPPPATRAAITLQSVTRGHLGRRLFQARCSQLARELMNEPQ
jgi:hypothetical protein